MRGSTRWGVTAVAVASSALWSRTTTSYGTERFLPTDRRVRTTLSPRPRVATTTVTAAADAGAAPRLGSATSGLRGMVDVAVAAGDPHGSSRASRRLRRHDDREARLAVREVGCDGRPGGCGGDEAGERRPMRRLVPRHEHLVDDVRRTRERASRLHQPAQAPPPTRRAFEDHLLLARAIDDELPRAAVDLEALLVDRAEGEERLHDDAVRQ